METLDKFYGIDEEIMELELEEAISRLEYIIYAIEQAEEYKFGDSVYHVVPYGSRQILNSMKDEVRSMIIELEEEWYED